MEPRASSTHEIQAKVHSHWPAGCSLAAVEVWPIGGGRLSAVRPYRSHKRLRDRHRKPSHKRRESGHSGQASSWPSQGDRRPFRIDTRPDSLLINRDLRDGSQQENSPRHFGNAAIAETPKPQHLLGGRLREDIVQRTLLFALALVLPAAVLVASPSAAQGPGDPRWNARFAACQKKIDASGRRFIDYDRKAAVQRCMRGQPI